MKLTRRQLRIIIESFINERIKRSGGLEVRSSMNPFGSSASSSEEDGDNKGDLKAFDELPDGGSGGSVSSSNLLNDLDPAAGKIKDFVNALKEKGYEVIITSTYRSIETQSNITSKGQDVASPGYSPHNFGLGIDLNIKWKSEGKVKQLMMASPNEEWLKVIGKDGPVPYEKFNLRWGGNFKKRDAVHFDVYNDPNIKVDGISAKDNPGGFVRALRKKAGTNANKKYSVIV